MLVTRDIGRRSGFAEVKNHRNRRLALRLVEVLSKKSPDIFGKGNAQLRRFGLGASLRIRIKRNLRASIHDRAIMPSRCRTRKELSKGYSAACIPFFLSTPRLAST